MAAEDDPELDIHDIPAFFRHLLERVDWTSDLHFQTRTTIDTLDYSGHGLNQGSKVVIAAAGPAAPSLADASSPPAAAARRLPLAPLVLPGVLAVQGPAVPRRRLRHRGRSAPRSAPSDPSGSFPLIVVVDDSEFTARSDRNFLWVTFTRSNPAADIDGIGRLRRAEALGLPRPAGDRRPDQAAPRAAAGR